MEGEVTDPQITTVETIITNDDLESDAVGEIIEAETYTDDFEVVIKCVHEGIRDSVEFFSLY